MRPARRTSGLFLVLIIAIGVVVGSLIPRLAVKYEGSAPRPTWAAAAVLLAAAVGVAIIGWHTWQQLHRKNLRIHVDRAIQLLALAKSFILVGGVFTGGYAGFTVAFLGDDSPLGRERFTHGLAATIAALLLLAAALFLEWACRLPVNEDDDKDKPRVDPSPA